MKLPNPSHHLDGVAGPLPCRPSGVRIKTNNKHEIEESIALLAAAPPAVSGFLRFKFQTTTPSTHHQIYSSFHSVFPAHSVHVFVPTGTLTRSLATVSTLI
jgi:hypothetical protein